MKQEVIISKALDRIEQLTAKYPDLKSEPNYIGMTDTIEVFENIIRTSRLVYNGNVKKLNRRIRMFPLVMIAGVSGFLKKDYLE